MRVVHVTDYFQPALGYQEYFLARAHQELGHTVTVVTSDRFFPFPSYRETVEPVLGPRMQRPGRFKERGVDVLRLASLELSGRPLIWMRGLEETLRSLVPDVVIGHELLSPTTWRLARARRAQGFRLVVDNHASEFNTRLDDSLAKRLYVALYRSLVAPLLRGQAAALVGIGPGEQALLCRVVGVPTERTTLIPLGADVRQFAPRQEERVAARARLEVPAGTVLVLHAGKLTAEKDVHVLIDAVRTLVEQGLDLRLLLVGGAEPAYLRVLEAAAGPDRDRWLIRLPPVSNSELPALLMAGDIGAWPGNISQVILEALAVGLPVVVPTRFEAGYSSAHLVALQNGVTFERGRTEELAAALRALAADPARRAEMGTRSRELAERDFSWDSVGRRFLAASEAVP